MDNKVNCPYNIWTQNGIQFVLLIGVLFNGSFHASKDDTAVIPYSNWTHVLLAKKGSDVTVSQMKSRENVNEFQALKERSRIH
jgi:hypothetical protein